MTRTRSANELILSYLDFFRVAQPLLDVKPGTVSRDIMIDAPSVQLARLYEELAGVSNLQSLRLSIGADLDRLAQNFGAVRQRGAKATGPALFTFTSIDADIAINQGDTVVASNGVTFQVLSSIVVSPVLENSYRATASKFRSDLDFVGITNDLAVEVLVEAVASGIQGNISKYTVNRTTIPNVNSVTNVFPFSGGRDTEDDATFRNRVLAIFSGANTGTELGYRNAVLADPSVIDSIVVGPGDDLMTRDGTQVSVAEDGTRTITSEGSGGKVDVYIFGTRIQEVIDSYIFRDLSNTGDTTNPDNDFVLGQITADAGKTVSRKRLDNLSDGVLPNQPVNNVIQITGSLSASNFAEKSTDELGRITGNFEIIKDTGAFAGSPWGFDRLHWISDRVSDFKEDKTKLSFNGQDPLAFTDVIEISSAQQELSVVNENSTVSSSDRSSIQLAHFPVKNVTRVFNVTTGERYVVSSQNPDGTGSVNANGRIVVSGQTLPAISDILQVDYTWIFSFDPSFDYDDRTTTSNPRSVRDSVDWGFSNAVRREMATLTSSGSFLTATVTHPITSVINVNVFTSESSNLTLSSGRLAYITAVDVSNVVSIVRISDGTDLWNTSDADGSFSGQTVFLPTDTLGQFDDAVTIVFNTIDVFNATTQGNFSSNVISIVPSSDATAGRLVECSYIADVNTLLPGTTLADLPAIRSSNTFDTDTATNIGSQPTTHIFSDTTIIKNLRRAPSVLGLNIVGSVSAGIITIGGATISRIADVVITATVGGLKQDLSPAIKTFLGLSTIQSVPSTIRIAKIVSVERVTTTSSFDVLTVENDYDIRQYKILDNNFSKEESVQDTTLSATQFELPATPDNTTEAPEVGDRLRVTFHITTYSDTENVSFSRSGQLHSNKIFALIDTIAISSGFISTTSAAAVLTVTNLNQPIARTRYNAFYDYTAPKVNERITIRYNYDRIITDATFNIESTRPIGADVLGKSSTRILVDSTMNIVVTEAFINNTEIVRQNVQDAVTSALNQQALGTIVDASDLIQAAYTVDGVDRARTLFFNKTGESGSVLSIVAQKNEFIAANTVTIAIESR